MDIRPACPRCDSSAVIVSDRGSGDERHAACAVCLLEWTLAEDWWVSLLGVVIPQRLEDGPATAAP